MQQLSARTCFPGAMPQADYPRWICHPRSSEPPDWVGNLLQVFRDVRDGIDSTETQLGSNDVLALACPGLEDHGFIVEGGSGPNTIRRPVHFGEQGEPDIEYRLDAYHPELELGLEVEAGRTIINNAVYKDVVQAALLVGLRSFALAVPLEYSYSSGSRTARSRPFEKCTAILDAIYTSSRLDLPLDAVLLIGY